MSKEQWIEERENAIINIHDLMDSPVITSKIKDKIKQLKTDYSIDDEELI